MNMMPYKRFTLNHSLEQRSGKPRERIPFLSFYRFTELAIGRREL